jgi:hypothetical protein
MGERGRARQRRDFSTETMVRHVSDLYQRLLTRNGVEPAVAEQTRWAAVD